MHVRNCSCIPLSSASVTGPFDYFNLSTYFLPYLFLFSCRLFSPAISFSNIQDWWFFLADLMIHRQKFAGILRCRLLSPTGLLQWFFSHIQILNLPLDPTVMYFSLTLEVWLVFGVWMLWINIISVRFCLKYTLCSSFLPNPMKQNMKQPQGLAPALTTAQVDARKKPVFCLSH